MRYKPIDFQPAKFDLMGGVDTKMSGLVLPAPKLQVCENAFADQTGSLERRPGRSLASSTVTDGTTMPTPMALAKYRDKALAFTAGTGSVGGAAYEYASVLNRWTTKGGLESPRVREVGVAKNGATTGTFAGDAATANGITVHVYEDVTSPSSTSFTSTVRMTIVDANGSVLRQGWELYSVTAATDNVYVGVKCAVRGNLVYMFYYDAVAADVMVAIVDTTSAATLGTMSPVPVSVVTDIDTVGPFFDVGGNATYGVFIAYASTVANQIKFGFVSTSGVLASTSTTATGAPVSFIAVDVSPGLAMHGICYLTAAALTDAFACHRSWSGSAWTATASSGALVTGITTNLSMLSCKYESALSTSLRLYACDGGVFTYPSVTQSTYTTAGVATTNISVMRHSWLTSKAALGPDLLQYYWVTYAVTFNNLSRSPTMYLMRQDGKVIARASVGDAALPLRSTVTLPRLELSGSTLSVDATYYWNVAENILEFHTSQALRRVSVEFAHSASHAYAEDGDELYVAGAIPQQYDGTGFVEVGFLNFPATTGVSGVQSSTVPGLLKLTSVYAYRLVYEWVNVHGKVEQSTDNGPVTMAVLTGANDTWTLTIGTLAHTNKTVASGRGGVVIAVYRTLADPTDDSPHYRVGQVANNPNVDTVSFVDIMSDNTAASKEALYLGTGEVDNVAPPPAHIIAAGNGRVFLAGMGDGSEIWYSKVRFPGMALAFSDLNTLQAPSNYGAITAMATMNGVLVAFTNKAIFYFTGDGPNNLGFGEFSQPELVTTDTGTRYPRSVVVTPMGIMFQGIKGMMLLTQGLTLSYIGAALENLAAPGAPTGASLVPAAQQVRFSYELVTYVYDYYHTQWYVYTHGSAGPTIVWSDVHAAVDGGMVYDNSAVWTDAGDAYVMKLVLGWVGLPTTRRGNLAVRSIGLTGESLDAHYLSVDVAYDQGAPAALVEETITAAGVLDPLWRVSQQICSVIEVTIRDAILNVYGTYIVQNTAGMKLNELVFEMGVRNSMTGRGA